MKLLDAVLLSLSVAFFIIGLHQIMTVGFANGYWAVMISTVLLFVLIYSRTQLRKTEAELPNKNLKKKGKKR
jgi:uncharacterized membrane protein